MDTPSGANLPLISEAQQRLLIAAKARIDGLQARLARARRDVIRLEADVLDAVEDMEGLAKTAFSGSGIKPGQYQIKVDAVEETVEFVPAVKESEAAQRVAAQSRFASAKGGFPA